MFDLLTSMKHVQEKAVICTQAETGYIQLQLASLLILLLRPSFSGARKCHTNRRQNIQNIQHIRCQLQILRNDYASYISLELHSAPCEIKTPQNLLFLPPVLLIDILTEPVKPLFLGKSRNNTVRRKERADGVRYC